MNLCIARLGSVANSILTPRIVKAFNVNTAVWCGTLSCFISFGSGIILTGLLKGSVKKSDDEESLVSNDPVSRFDDSESDIRLVAEPKEIEQSVSYLNIFKLPVSFWLVCVICICLYGTVVPFNTIASDFLMEKWYHGDIQMAGFVMR